MKAQDLADLKQLIDFLKEHQVAEFDLDRGDLKIRLKFNQPGGSSAGLGELARLIGTAPSAVAHAAAALARGKVTAAQAALDLARLQLSYTRVAAPADGRVAALTARVAQILSPGQPFAEFVPNHTYVTANLKETQTGEMRAGQRAKITISAYGGRTFEGRVESLSAGTGAVFSLLPPNDATGNFVKVVQRVPVRIAFVAPPTDVTLRAGLSVDVTVYVR